MSRVSPETKQCDETVSEKSTRRHVLQAATGSAVTVMSASNAVLANDKEGARSVQSALQLARRGRVLAREIRLPSGVRMEGDVDGMISPEVAQSLQNIVMQLPDMSSNPFFCDYVWIESNGGDDMPVRLRLSSGML